MDYTKSLKTAEQLLEEIRSGAQRNQSLARVEETKEEFRQGLVRRKQSMAPKEPREPDYVTGFLSPYLELATVLPEEDLPMSTKGGTGAIKPVKSDLGAAREALAQVESSGNYSAVGPLVKKGMYKGQRAYGRYQVMEGNIAPWTKAATGRVYSKAEFLANKDGIQDKVVEYQLQKSFKKYGTWEDAASVWFSGRPMGKAGNASDGFNTVPEYIAKFQNALGKVRPSPKKDQPARPKARPLIERNTDEV